MDQLTNYLPNISSIYGIMFYSFISYWIIYALGILIDRLMKSNEKENKKMKKIIKEREYKK